MYKEKDNFKNKCMDLNIILNATNQIENVPYSVLMLSFKAPIAVPGGCIEGKTREYGCNSSQGG